MADNTTLNTGVGGDTIRDIDRGTGAKTQVMQLDCGGANTNAEVLISAGQKLNAFSVPVVLSADTDPSASIRLGVLMQQSDLLQNQANAVNGFLPLEIPSFLIGV